MKPHRLQPRTQRAIVSEKGFSLVEVMIGAVIFTLAMLGMLSTTMLAYKYTLQSRYRERAANALLTMASQFQNSPITDHATSTTKKLFQTTSGGTGTGMSWDPVKQCFAYPGTTDSAGNILAEGTDALGLSVPLNTVSDSNVQVTATVTREVSSVNDRYPITSTPSSPQVYMLEATFTATYNFLGVQTISIKVLRTVTPSDLAE